MTIRRVNAVLIVLVLFGTIAPIILRPATADAQVTSVVINEFLAVNEATLADNTGQFEDWIELRNTTGSTIDLGGWTLADSSNAFTFPGGTSLGGGQYLVVWASGDVSRTTASEIHLPFRLSGEGESLTLSDPNGASSQPSWPAPGAYPVQLEDDSYGVASGGQIRYFTNPTPGAANGGGVGGLVSPVTFSIDHGFYSSTQSVVLGSPTSGATIRYTTNGDVPSSTVGTAVTPGTAIDISSTTTLRAVAYRDGWIPSPIETRSYLFTADIVQQTGTPAGWPAGAVNGQIFDHGMDPDVVTGNEPAIEAALEAIPTLSITTDLDNLFDPTDGIWVNAAERGAAWERQASVELIDPSGQQTGFDIEAGIRIRGGFSRNDGNAKHSLRLFFRDEYESELDYPLFGAEGDDRFEKVDLRTSQNFAWQWRRSDEATWVDEVWSRDTQAAMGNPYTRSRQYHVYLNGVYNGIYMTQERVSGEFGESYLGGGEDDFDVVKRGAPGREFEATNGTDTAWRSLYSLVSDLNVSNAEYSTIESQVDLVNLADYYLLHFWTGDYDGSPSYFLPENGRRYAFSNNWYALRNRNGVGQAARWTFFDHDSEHSLCANNGPALRENIDNTTPWNLNAANGSDYMTPAWLHAALISHPAYRQIFADRVQLHMLTPGGALTESTANARLDLRVAELTGAIDAESARWGDGATRSGVVLPSPYGRSEWNNGIQLLRDCFADRPAIVEAQLREDGLWPLTEPPVIAPAAGGVSYGSNVTVNANGQPGTLYVTSDGTDPRATDGSVSPAAQAYSGPLSITADTTVQARVLSNGQWTPLASSAFVLTSGAGPVSLVLNEFNAVSGGRFLGDGAAADVANGTDATLGRVLGNGGDWVEFAVVEDGLDIRGWTIEVWNQDLGTLTNSATLTLSNAAVLSDLRAGSLVTISEDIADDVSYNPVIGDWHLNLQSNSSLAGAYITAGTQSNFAINNDDTQIAVFDATGAPVQLRTGEGTVPLVSVSGTEVFKLEGTPTPSLSSSSPLYSDGTSSTFGLPNIFNGGAEVQDLGRFMFGDVNCDARISIADAVFIAQHTVGVRPGTSTCDGFDSPTQAMAPAADVNTDGRITIGDAVLIAQCTAGLQNSFCPDGLP